jgi:hypothetical protein
MIKFFKRVKDNIALVFNLDNLRSEVYRIKDDHDELRRQFDDTTRSYVETSMNLRRAIGLNKLLSQYIVNHRAALKEIDPDGYADIEKKIIDSLE